MSLRGLQLGYTCIPEEGRDVYYLTVLYIGLALMIPNFRVLKKIFSPCIGINYFKP